MKYSNTDVLRAEMLNQEFTHKHEGDTQRCPLCWSQHCNHDYDLESDPFINMSEEVAYNNEIILYA